MGLFTRDKATAARAVTPSDKFKVLGIAGQPYATHGGQEYVIDGGAGVADALDLPFSPGYLIHSTKVRETVDGEVFEVTRYRLARPVPAGTYARLAAKKAARIDASPRPVDVHALVPRVVTGTAEFVIRGPGRGLRNDKFMVASPDVFGATQNGAHYSPPTPTPEAPAEVIAWYADRKKIVLSLRGDRLLAAPKGGRNISWAMIEDIRADERRLVAYLAGRWPLPCELHPDRPAHDAVRTFAIDVLGCDE